jgi:hypothetical protein
MKGKVSDSKSPGLFYQKKSDVFNSVLTLNYPTPVLDCPVSNFDTNPINIIVSATSTIVLATVALCPEPNFPV